MGHTKTDYTKIKKIALSLGLVETHSEGVYWSHANSTKSIDLTASGNDFESVAKNIIRQLQNLK